MNREVRVGVAVIIFKNNQVLLGKRITEHGQNLWAFPGGHLEFGESIEECAIRETKEETNLDVFDVKKLTFTNDIFEDKYHYITIFTTAMCGSDTLENLEPHKCEGWQWFDPKKLPTPRFLPVENLLKEGHFPQKS